MANQFVAYQDERHGLGAWVAEQIAADLFRNKTPGVLTPEEAADKGVEIDPGDRQTNAASPLARSHGMSLAAPGRLSASPPPTRTDQDLDYAYRTWTSPRTTAESTLSSVIGGQAQIGVLPLYDHDLSFSKDTLNALMDFQANSVIREYVAESNYVLAAPTDLVHEIEQSGFTDSFSATGSSSSFQWNRDKQLRYKRKVSTIYASADAMQHCQAALEGYRAQGVDVQLIPDGVDAYREGLSRAYEMLDPNRRVETTYSGNTHTRVSRTRGANHTKPLVGVLLSADKAMPSGGYAYDRDYVVLENEMAGADRIRSSFIALQKGAPAVVPPNVDAIRFEMGALEGRFGRGPKRKSAGSDHRALYPIAGDTSPDGRTPAGPPAYVRVLYAINTVGDGVKDVSPVMKALAEQQLSFTTTTLDNRPGHPMIFAIDVPSGESEKMRPVLRQITRMMGWRRIADFPALQPMVKETIRPAAASSPRTRTALGLIAAVLIAVAGFVLWQM